MKRHTRQLVKVIEQEIGRNATQLGAEVGVWRGGNAQGLLRQFPNLELLMIDPYDEAGNHETMVKKPTELRAAKNEAEAKTRFAVKRRQVLIKTSEAAAKEVEDGSLDFVFIDACHLYEYVKQDIDLWTPKVREGGVLSGHDYGGVLDKKGVWGVSRAVDEFASQRGLEVNTRPGLVWWIKMKQAE